jgi:thioredoxin-like negative regulator of GroEL
VLIAARFESIESFRAQWWIGMRLIDGQDPARGLDWLRQAVDLNPNELRLQLDYVRGLLLSNRAEAARALVATLPPAEAARDVYLAQSHIQLDELDRARGVVREGLVRFPNDARLLRQARELGLEGPYR